MKIALWHVVRKFNSCLKMALTFGCLFVTALSCPGQMKGGKMQNVSAETAVKGDSYAVIFGISDYPGLPPLKYADKDAVLFRDFLTTPAGGSVRPENIFFKINEDAKAAEFNIQARKWLKGKKFKEGDRVYIYFSGHGDAYNEENYYLLPFDCMPNNDPDNYLSTGVILMHTIKTIIIPELERQNAEVLLIVDACRTNELPGGAKGQQSFINSVQSSTEKSAGEIIMLSAGAGQSAIESLKVGNGHGLFTWYLIAGLSGAADKEGDAADHDGKVSLAEITSYVKNHVRKEAKLLYNANQVPVFLPPDRDLETIAMVDSDTYRNWRLAEHIREQTGGNVLAAVNNKVSAKGIKPGQTTDTALITLDNKFIAAVKQGRLSGKNSAEEFYNRMRDKWPNEPLTDDTKYSLATEYINFGQEKINLFLSGKGIIQVQHMESEFSTGLNNPPGKRMSAETAEQLERMKYLAKTGFDKAAAFMEKAVNLLSSSPELLGQLYPKLYFLQAAAFDARNNITGRRQGIALLKKAIKNDSAAAYDYLMLGHIYYNLKNDSCELYFKKAKQLAPKWADPENGLANFYSYKKRPALAIMHYHEALRLDSLDGLAVQNIGVLYADEGKPDSAIKYFRLGLAINPCENFANSNMGTIHAGFMKSKIVTDPNFRMSEKYLKKAIACDSAFTRAYLQLAGLFDKVNKRDSSIYFLEKGIAINHDDASLYRALGDEYYEMHDLKGSEAAYFKGLKADSLDVETYLSLIWLYQNSASNNDKTFGTPNEEYNKTMLYAMKALKVDPQNAYSYNAMGDVRIALKDNDGALTSYQTAVKIDPVYTDALNGLGNAYFSKGDYDKAQANYLKTIAINPKFEFGWRNLGGAYFAKGDLPNAEASYLKAVTLNPAYTNGFRRLGMIYYKQAFYDKSVSSFKKALKIDTANADAYNELGKVYYRQKHYDTSVYCQQQAVKYASANAYMYTDLGFAQEAMNNTDQAIAAYSKAIQLDANYVLPYANLGFLYQRMKRYDKSISFFEQAIRLKPGYALLLNSIADVYREEGNNQKVLFYYKQSLQSDSTQTAHLQDLGMAYIYSKDFTNGLKYLEKGANAFPRDPIADYNLACGWVIAGDTRKGIKYLSDALDKGYKDYNHLKQDPDLENLRKLPEFTALIKQHFPGSD